MVLPKMILSSVCLMCFLFYMGLPKDKGEGNEEI